ncbi:MAG: DUF2088 domain-containing protein [Bacillaceae bacterium]|nr:DUF2088 domain-containing protein [Bacillaceae bacterium]
MKAWPKLYKIKQKYDDQPVVRDLETEINQQVAYILDGISLSPGARIAITAGSRGISGIIPILRAVVNQLKGAGFEPFLVSAMGSHGGGTEEGQQAVLTSLGITEENTGCPVSVSSEVILLGTTDTGIQGLPVYMAKEAAEADGILVLNRIKPHTSFSGPFESGLVKMMAVGLGRAEGAAMVHSLGAEKLAESIPSIARKVLEKGPVIGGIGIVENAMEQTAIIKGLRKTEILEKEKELLVKARQYMPKLPVRQVDFAVIREMGKNYSGTGMDTNVIGRLRIEGVKEPDHIHIKYLAVLDLSEASHGNATGIGLADFTTQRLVDKMDREATYLNTMTTGFVTRAAIPMTFADDRDLFAAVNKVLRMNEPSKLNMVVLNNTLHLDELWVSESIYEDIKQSRGIEYVDGPVEIRFEHDRLSL